MKWEKFSKCNIQILSSQNRRNSDRKVGNFLEQQLVAGGRWTDRPTNTIPRPPRCEKESSSAYFASSASRWCDHAEFFDRPQYHELGEKEQFMLFSFSPRNLTIGLIEMWSKVLATISSMYNNIDSILKFVVYMYETNGEIKLLARKKQSLRSSNRCEWL